MAIPVSLKELFAGTTRSDVDRIPIRTTDGKSIFASQDKGPTTAQVIETCGRIQTLDKKTGLKPRLLTLGGGEFALTESEMISGLSLGSWAVFARVDNRYCLRAVMDFR